MEWIAAIITSVVTLIGGGIGGYFLYPRKHPVDVRQGEAVAEASEIQNIKAIIHIQREEISTMLENQKQERHDCDEKIAKLREEMNEMSITIAKHSKTLNDARNSCNSGCFADQNAA